jgi:hypothetical protein
MNFLRLEAPFYGIIFLTSFYRRDSSKQKDFLFLATIYAFFTAFYYTILLSLGGYSWTMGTILTPEKIVVLISLILMLPIALWTSEKYDKSRAVIFHPGIIIFLSLLLVIIAGFFYKPEHMVKSLEAFFINLFGFTAGWGIFWYILLIFYSGAFIIALKNRCVFFIPDILIVMQVILLIIALGIFRIPYRTGWGDSGNRMMVHIIPLGVYGLIEYIINVKYLQQIKKELGNVK